MAGVRGGAMDGMATGAVTGAFTGVKQARQQYVNPWTGKPAAFQDYAQSINGITLKRKVGYGSPVEELQIQGTNTSYTNKSTPILTLQM